MFGEYGYMEEGKLGKPHNFKLLKRLAHYAVPYKKAVFSALLLTILITIIDLTVPYFSKIAIDHYILSAWYRMDPGKLAGHEAQRFFTDYNHLLIKEKDGSFCFISHLKIKKIDPRDLYTYKARRIISQERFYKTKPDAIKGLIPEKRGWSVHNMNDGSVLIPYKLLNSLSREEVIKIRAGDIRGISLIAVVFIGLIVISLGFSYAEYYILEFIGQRLMMDIRLSLFQRIQAQSVRFFDRHPVGRLVTRVTNDIENLNEMFKSVIITVFKDFFLLVGILIVILYLDWRLAMISLLLLPLIFGLTFLFSSMAREAFRELRATVAKINVFLQERFTGMRIIQLFVREKYQMEIFRRINHQNYMAGIKQLRVFAVFMPVMELISSFAVALIIWYGGGEVIKEQLSLGSLVAFISYIQMFFRPIRDISEKYNIMQSAMASAERIFQFMDNKEEIPESKRPLIPPVVNGHLVFKEVSFAYNKDNQVLRQVSFEVKPGETVAVVGATGAGKTSLVNLVERFYDPDVGTVSLDGIDLKKWPKEELRKNIGICMQDEFIFAGNLSQNISLGREDIDSEKIKQIAKKVNALPFIQRLPNEFNEDIGEGGATLSAGERQLLSLARALISNPKVIILDEATSSVDPETEGLVQKAVSQVSAGRSTLIVAHRLSTIRNADCILVMRRGRIIERGTHKELMALGGAYFALNR